MSGETVKTHVGGDLTLSSQQVTDKYDSKQQSGSVSGSIGTGLNTSASVNANKIEMHSDYQSVDKQTGINAGKGSFDITVGKHTQLDGAVISSTAEADKNTLALGTLKTRPSTRWIVKVVALVRGLSICRPACGECRRVLVD
ncbi:hemagglutinin repeat-containing protein [Providencia stuartii]|uniref:hemagglutinin repeat-containing protein n=1 Tax=Providencia stuartii TaxID=588 RepID=UPI00300C2741